MGNVVDPHESAAFVQKILDIARPPQHLEVNGRAHVAVPPAWTVREDYSPAISLIAITLQAVVDYATQMAGPDAEDSLLVHVSSHDRVAVLTALDAANRRECLLLSTVPSPPPDLLPLKTWLAPDKMILGLLALMEETGERDDLVKMLSHIKDGRVIEAEDDGIGQSITVKSGITLVAPKALRSFVTLEPRWTFGEIEQPYVDFVLRAKSGEGETLPTTLPTFSLTLADVAWQHETILRIKTWLKERLPKGAIIIA